MHSFKNVKVNFVDVNGNRTSTTINRNICHKYVELYFRNELKEFESFSIHEIKQRDSFVSKKIREYVNSRYDFFSKDDIEYSLLTEISLFFTK